MIGGFHSYILLYTISCVDIQQLTSYLRAFRKLECEVHLNSEKCHIGVYKTAEVSSYI